MTYEFRRPRTRRAQLAAVLASALLLACGQEAVEEDPPLAEPAAPPVGATADGDATLDLFVEEPATASQLVFVGRDSTVRPAGQAGVFVPFSTFSVERDGIPNEFPPPDSMAMLLEEAGVRGDDVVIVADPIPAGRAYAALDYLGLGERAALLDGGRGALATASEPDGAGSEPDDAVAVDGARAPDSAATPDDDVELDIDVRDDMIVDAAWVHARLDDPSVAILDARPPAEFSGETPGDGIDRPGHIPGARNVFWQTLVESAENPRLKDEAELRRMFREAGVDPGDTVVSYCRTGGQASFLYTVARHLGYDVKLYDGSYIDWSRTEYPVER